MAKSIYDILKDLTTTTSVPGFGDEIQHTIPENLFPDDSTFEDAALLLEWANDQGFTHALLQKGIQKGLIDLRATFKACKKTDTWSVDYGQKNVNAMEWTITKRPNVGGAKAIDKARYNDCLAMFGKLAIGGMETAQIEEMATAVYGAEIVKTVVDALTE